MYKRCGYLFRRISDFGISCRRSECVGLRCAVDDSKYVAGLICRSNCSRFGNIANGLSLVDGALIKDQGIEFSPRVGFAFDVTGKQDLVIRGGFAMFFDRAQGNLVYDYNQNLPTTFTSSVFNAFLSDITTNATSYGTPQSIRAIDPKAKIRQQIHITSESSTNSRISIRFWTSRTSVLRVTIFRT